MAHAATAHTPIHELPRAVLAMAHGYVKGDEARMNAVLRLCYQDESLGVVAAETGIAKSTLSDLRQGFSELCGLWHDRHKRCDDLDGEHAGGDAA
jgi:hypothetical protein